VATQTKNTQSVPSPREGRRRALGTAKRLHHSPSGRVASEIRELTDINCDQLGSVKKPILPVDATTQAAQQLSQLVLEVVHHPDTFVPPPLTVMGIHCTTVVERTLIWTSVGADAAPALPFFSPNYAH
jgi:hypothetical protein